MKFIAFNGSPAAANSRTEVIVQAFFRGAQRAGAEMESVYLIEEEIDHCRGCFACWFKTPGQCVRKDGMAALLQKYKEADVVCFATPVYTWNMTAALKNFVDRLAPLKSPLLQQQGGRFDLADTEVKQQKFIVISNSGFPGEQNFETMKAVFASSNPTLEIYRNCGMLLKSKDENVQAVVAKYLQIVEQAGYELASNGIVSAETAEALNMPLMSVPDYVKYIGM